MNKKEIRDANIKDSRVGIVIAIIAIILLFVIPFIVSLNQNSKPTNRDFDYNQLKNEARETGGLFDIQCTDTTNTEEIKRGDIIECSIKMDKDFIRRYDRKRDKEGYLEYLLLEYEDTRFIEITSANITDYMNLDIKDYFEVTFGSNKIVVENTDSRSYNQLNQIFSEDGKTYYYEKRPCWESSDHYGKKICRDSPAFLVLHVKLRANDDLGTKFVIDNFKNINIYECSFNQKGSKCYNNKESNMEIVLDMKKQSENENNTQPVKENNTQPEKENNTQLEKGLNIQPEKEVNIDINNEEEVLNLGNRLWKYAYGTYWGNRDVWIKHLSEEPNEHGAHYDICDTSFENVKKKYTEDAIFTMKYEKKGIPIDQYVRISTDGCGYSGRGADQLYKTTTLKIDKIEENIITYIATSEFCSSSFCGESEDPEISKTVETIEKPFVIKKVNDEWLIHSYYLPN